MKIFVAGHNGLVGSAIVRALNNNGYHNIITQPREKLNLLNQQQVALFFKEMKPDIVFLAAAKVGGIHANNIYPANFIYENIMIQTNIIHASYLSNVKRLLFLGSSCIYPKHCPQPIKEEYLLTGLLESTNQPYALAKIAGIELCHSYNRQYGTQYLPLMPTNLYGPNDNFDLDTSHVLPALLRKAHKAKMSGAHEMQVWGSGKIYREFLYVDDLANACLFFLNLSDKSYTQLFKDVDNKPLFNIGTGEDILIEKLVDLVCVITGFTGSIKWDASKPDGTPRKLLDISKIKNLGWSATTSLEIGLRKTYDYFLHTAGITA